MDARTKEALQAVDRAVAQVQRQREAGWPPLTPDYLAAIEAVERLPENQSGSDKSWMWEAVVQARRHFASVRRA